ncbi:MAG: cupredoxin domain-containing protein, partial [Chloroflexota bacterium]|nr:cupredoxin domain-containing protein [Chloroflexota bacterium]
TGQQPDTTAGSLLFTQTGKRLGGRFLQYWQQNGGLAQQGYPISDVFSERSALDGKTYQVQYFERAVFEAHPENAAPYDVLLSQLGTFRYQAKYAASRPTPVSTILPAPTLQAATEQAVTVTLREWAIDISGPIKAGKVNITVTNTGGMAHNLTIANSSGAIARTSNFRSSDGPQTLIVDLTSGTYTFYCSLPGHAQRGQTTQIVVK